MHTLTQKIKPWGSQKWPPSLHPPLWVNQPNLRQILYSFAHQKLTFTVVHQYHLDISRCLELVLKCRLVLGFLKYLRHLEYHSIHPYQAHVDGVGPTNMSGNLPGKKSQLDLRPFGVGVPIVGRTVSPWTWFHTKESKVFLLVERVWHMQEVKEDAWVVRTHGGWGECNP